MNPEEAPIPLEREIGRRWTDHTTGNCLTGEELVALAALGERCRNYEAWMSHVVSCASCRQLLQQFRALEAEWKPGIAAGMRPVPRRLVWASALLVIIVVSWFGAPAFLNNRIQIALKDAGGRVALTASNRLRGLPELLPAEQALLVSALRSGRTAPAPILASLRTPVGTSAASFAFPVRAPHGTVIESGRPEFRWKMPSGAAFCRVFLTCSNGAGKNVKTKALTAERWKPKRPLIPGAVYDWQIIAYDRRGKARARVPDRAGTLRFKVLESEQAAALARLRQTAGGSHLVMGVHYAHEGLLEEAEQEFTALAQANPGSSVAQSLLQSVQAMRET